MVFFEINSRKGSKYIQSACHIRDTIPMRRGNAAIRNKPLRRSSTFTLYEYFSCTRIDRM